MGEISTRVNPRARKWWCNGRIIDRCARQLQVVTVDSSLWGGGRSWGGGSGRSVRVVALESECFVFVSDANVRGEGQAGNCVAVGRGLQEG